MSLTTPHPIWTSCGTNPWEINRAIIAAKMLSDRYLTDWLQRHWTENRGGVCSLPGCRQQGVAGTLEDLLLLCHSLEQARGGLHNLASKVSSEHAVLGIVINDIFGNHSTGDKMQLLLDPSTIPLVIQATQILGNHIRDRLMYLGRAWCYTLHRERVTQLGLLKYR